MPSSQPRALREVSGFNSGAVVVTGATTGDVPEDDRGVPS